MNYLSRTWLTQSFSKNSAFILFYCNKDCKNKDNRYLIKIYDGAITVDFWFKTESSMRNFAKDILDVATGKSKSRSRSCLGYYYKVSLNQLGFDFKRLYFGKVQKSQKIYEKFSSIRNDKKCDALEWKIALETIKNECQSFLNN